MSSISNDPRIDRAGLDPLGGRAALDDLRREQAAGETGALRQVADVAPQPVVEFDPGESVLKLLAWEGIPEGQRLLAGDTGFERQLGAMDLSQAADHAADRVLAALG